ncbi:hypothetical protein LTS02_001940 [Friedmanniomyces endolithicus]|nr:hypothetical protein LTS02_001940 [Friedmanniomyces endolithicus]
MAPIQRKVHINVDVRDHIPTNHNKARCSADPSNNSSARDMATSSADPSPDDELIPLIDHANVACGFHAGDPLIMAETVKTCKQHGIAIGAHPGLPDIQGFGRREMKLSAEELTALTRYQIGALKAFLDAEDVPLHHVKPHGVLYGMMYRDPEVCRAVYSAVPKGKILFSQHTFESALTTCLFNRYPRLRPSRYSPRNCRERTGLAVRCGAIRYALPISDPKLVSSHSELTIITGDVKYTSSGTLVIDRKKKYTLLPDPLHTFSYSCRPSITLPRVQRRTLINIRNRAWTREETKAHIASQLNHSSVTAVTGETVELPIGDHEVSLCCHSDSPGAVEIVQAARQMVDDFNKSQNYI